METRSGNQEKRSGNRESFQMETKQKILENAWVPARRIPKYECFYDYLLEGFQLTDIDRLKTFDVDLTPWYKIIADWFEDPRVRWIWLIWAAQTGKTTLMMAMYQYIAQYVTGQVPSFWSLASEEKLKEFMAEKLKPFIEENFEEAIKDWKNRGIRFGNTRTRFAYGTTPGSYKTYPSRFSFLDECAEYQVAPKASIAARHVTYTGKDKGILGSTPPLSGEHVSWKEATASNFFVLCVPCLKCGHQQPMFFNRLKWYDRKPGTPWNSEAIKESVRFICESCGHAHEEFESKHKMITNYSMRCVDPNDEYREVAEVNNDTRSLNVTGLASPSIFQTWGDLACEFVGAKAGGAASLKLFFSDKLAEVPKEEFGEKLVASELKRYKVNRQPGDTSGFPVVTMGVDVQRTGQLFYVLLGWRPAMTPAAHVCDYGILNWRGAHNQPVWDELYQLVMPLREQLYCATMDCTDGAVTGIIRDFCSCTPPFVALMDKGQQPKNRVNYKTESANRNARGAAIHGVRYIEINSDMIKDDIAAAFKLPPEDPAAWTFHTDTDDRFFTHLANEHRVTRKSRYGNRVSNTWQARYTGAPQHFFSALVYAVAAVEDWRSGLQDEYLRSEQAPDHTRRSTQPTDNVVSGGVDIWE